MRDLREGICTLCDHTEILEVEAAEFGNADAERRMCVTYDKRWVQAGRNPQYGHGPLHMYVCRGCGYVQWFAAAPGEIPVNQELRTRIIPGPAKDTPYR